MFHESSTIVVSLYREVSAEDGRVSRVHVEDGTWEARDASGLRHRIAWSDRVRRPELRIFDQEIHASYGAATQLARLQAALDDVADHTFDDAETTRLFAEVTVRRNGHEPYAVTLASAPRRTRGGR